jgi:hypothetical protein
VFNHDCKVGLSEVLRYADEFFKTKEVAARLAVSSAERMRFFLKRILLLIVSLS